MNANPLQFGPHTLILILGIVQGLFLALLLLASRGPAHQAWRWLGVFLLCFSLMQVEDVLYESRALLRIPQLYNTLTLLVFMLGPSMYLFVRTLTRSEARLGRWDWLHFALPALFVALSVPSFFASRATKLAAVQADYASGSFYFNPSIILPLLQLLIYMLLIAVLLTAHAERIRGRYSSLAGLDLRWATWFWIVNMMLGGLWIAFYALRSERGIVALDTVCTILVYVLGYVGWRQGGAFTRAIQAVEAPPGDALALSDVRRESDGPALAGSQVVGRAAEEAVEAAAKYARSGLTLERRQAVLQEAEQAMSEERLYRDPLLTLPKLARRLAVSPNHLSQAINEERGETFFDFVNGHRVREVKSRLEDPAQAHLTILALASEAGFNSKSAFNAAFRKHTGTTPSSVRRAG